MRFDSTLNLQKSGAIIEVQPDNETALLFGTSDRPQSMLYFWLKKKQYQGRTLTFSIEARGQDLSGDLVFGLQGKKDGQLAWPVGAGKKGTFDWKTISFEVDFSTLAMESLAVRIGLQNTSGKLWVRRLWITGDGHDNTQGNAGASNPGRHGSVDFGPNRFHVPNYRASRNLIQNPSFEAGMEFWTPGVWGALDELPEDGEPLLTLDHTTAVDGRVSMRQRVIEGGKGGWPPATFAIPLQKGATYTLSFYAKTDDPDAAIFEVTGITDKWDKFLPKSRYKLGTEWARYTYEFTSPEKMVQLHLGAPRAANPCLIWIDAVQLEAGDRATEFTRVPVAVSLITSTADNLSQPGDAIQARLSVSTTAPTSGTVTYELRDFFGTVVHSGTSSFTTVEADAPVEVALAACDDLDSGTYVIEATATLASGVAHTTWHRLVRMHYMTQPFKHRDLFCIPEVRGNGDWKSALLQAQRIGFGSFEFSVPPPAAYKKLVAEHGFVTSGDVFRLTGWPRKVAGKYRLAHPNFGLDAPISDADIGQISADVAAHAVETVQANPDFVVFETVNEPFCHTEDDIENVVKVLRAVRMETQKVKPDVRFMTPDCANIDHTMKYLETFFEKGGAEVCDIVALHTYRGHPDALDGDLAKVIGLTDKYKPGAEIWSTEGGYYNTYIIPDIGFPRVTHGGDHYRAGNVSYDLGLGEKIALAYQTRFRVQALKYADRLRRDVDWNDVTDWRTSFGIQRIPTAGVFATNTVARFLGDADFVADLSLPQALRGYMFQDSAQRPVAVIWYTDDAETLYDDRNPAIFDPSQFAVRFEAFSVVGGAISTDAEIKLTGYPIFLRGEPGQLAALQQALESARYEFPDVGDHLGHTFDLTEDGLFTATFHNRFNKRLQGELVCRIAGEDVIRTTLDLEPYGTFERTMPVPPSGPKMTTIHYSIRFNGPDGTTFAEDLELKYVTAPKVQAGSFDMAGAWEKWDAIESIRTDNTSPQKAAEHFGATTRWAWNEDFLYCHVEVEDSAFTPSPTIQFPTHGDCVELFFDAYADSVKHQHHKHEGYAEDDQYYTMWFDSDGSADAYRTQEAHWQLSFNKPGRASAITGSYEVTDTGYRMQMAFPMREIQPVDLVAGGCFGMNVLIHNKGVGKTMYGSGETPLSWRSPRNYVFVFLGK